MGAFEEGKIVETTGKGEFEVDIESDLNGKACEDIKAGLQNKVRDGVQAAVGEIPKNIQVVSCALKSDDAQKAVTLIVAKSDLANENTAEDLQTELENNDGRRLNGEDGITHVFASEGVEEVVVEDSNDGTTPAPSPTGTCKKTVMVPRHQLMGWKPVYCNQ